MPARGRPLAVRERSQVDVLVLASLAESPRDCFEVRDALADLVGDKVTVPDTRIVPTLHRLARNRLVTRRPADPRRYALTATGRRVLARRTRATTTFADAVGGLQRAD